MHQKFSIMMAIWTVLFCTASMAVTTNSAAREDSAILLKLVSGKAVQGGMLVFQTKAGTKIILDGLELPVSADGLFVLGFHRDDVTPQELRAIDASGKTAKLTLTPEMRDWEIQRIDNLPTNMVTPPEAVITRIKKDIKNVKAARAVISDFDDVLKNGFVWPVWGRISGIYGAQRILNGKPRQPHYGIDIAAPSGVAVRAAGAGRVTMAMDLYFTGGTVIIDHGFGLNSTYSHLKDMYVRPGDRVTRGGVIGSVGSTGRSTGPHLDWRINWRHKRLDPLLIAGPLRPALPASRPK
ncbi:MAG: Murein DD-endopeptidase MepM [Rhodospirillaceae bacterium]|jgi:murein DD-endopeptidase MepM/ murein hydrolase activator NlpD|nr:MAG: Murein DD-endopeptidase MepM [Rhodospirillaceae bacterium]